MTIRLRKHQLEGAAILHEKFGLNPRMYQYSSWNPYETLEMSENTVKGFIEDYSKKHFYAWAIEKDCEMVGTIGAYDYDEIKRSIEVGFSVMEEYWGQGIAGEALECVLKYLLSKKDIDIVKAWCMSENIASRHVLEKCGMKEKSRNNNILNYEIKKQMIK